MTSPKFLLPKDKNPPVDIADCWKRTTWSKQMCVRNSLHPEGTLSHLKIYWI